MPQKNFFNSSFISKGLSNITEPQERKHTYLTSLWNFNFPQQYPLRNSYCFFFSLPSQRQIRTPPQASSGSTEELFIIQNLGLDIDVIGCFIRTCIRKISILKNQPTWCLSKLVSLLCHDMIYFQISLLIVHKVLHVKHKGLLITSSTCQVSEIHELHVHWHYITSANRT